MSNVLLTKRMVQQLLASTAAAIESLRDFVQKKRYSRKKIANGCKLSTSTVSKFLNGKYIRISNKLLRSMFTWYATQLQKEPQHIPSFVKKQGARRYQVAKDSGDVQQNYDRHADLLAKYVQLRRTYEAAKNELDALKSAEADESCTSEHFHLALSKIASLEEENAYYRSQCADNEVALQQSLLQLEESKSQLHEVRRKLDETEECAEESRKKIKELECLRLVAESKLELQTLKNEKQPAEGAAHSTTENALFSYVKDQQVQTESPTVSVNPAQEVENLKAENQRLKAQMLNAIADSPAANQLNAESPLAIEKILLETRKQLRDSLLNVTSLRNKLMTARSDDVLVTFLKKDISYYQSQIEDNRRTAIALQDELIEKDRLCLKAQIEIDRLRTCLTASLNNASIETNAGTTKSKTKWSRNGILGQNETGPIGKKLCLGENANRKDINVARCLSDDDNHSDYSAF